LATDSIDDVVTGPANTGVAVPSGINAVLDTDAVLHLVAGVADTC